jgi:hypothetical protein
MPTEVDQTSKTPSKLIHETVDQLSTIVSIAQFALITEELPPKLQDDLKRIIQSARGAADHIKELSDLVREGE